MQREIIVQGNPRVYKALKEMMNNIYEQLQHIGSVSEMSPEMHETLKLIAVTLDGMKEESQ